MRLCVLILVGSTAVAFAQAAKDRQAAYGELRDEAHATKLVAGVADDIDKGRYESALKKADEAVRLKPGDSTTLNARGATLTELRRFDEAEKTLNAAVAADPKAFPPQYNLGEVLAMQKKYAEALYQFNMLQTHFGAMPVLKFKIYLCNALNGNKEQAAAALDLINSPMDGPAWYYAHAVDNLLAGKRAEARRLIAVAEAIHKDDFRTYNESLQNAGLLK